MKITITGSRRSIRADQYDDVWENIKNINQEFTSENTSINNGNNLEDLPAVFKMPGVKIGKINLDYGGGKFDNVAEYYQTHGYQFVNLVIDPFNRSKDHNYEVIQTLRDIGGAYTATCSNVLNVVKEKKNRMDILQNMKKLVRPGGTIYITVYEADGSGDEGETTSGYQLRRKTKEYMDEIYEVFPNAKRKGKLITIVNQGGSAKASARIGKDLIVI